MNFATLTSARVLAFAIGTGIFTITGNFVAPQHAYAFGMSDITGFAEDVWEIGADGVERAGRAIGKEAQKIGRGTITSNNPPPRRIRRTSGRRTGSGHTTTRPARGNAAATSNPAGNTALPPARGNLRPSGNTALPPARGTSSSSALPTGNTALPPARGTSSSSALPTGNTALPPARGNAKPTGNTALPPPRRPNETVPVNPGQRPTPITEEDIKPPFCNSKFENCSDNHGGHGGHGHGHHDHHDKKGKKAKKWKKFKNWSNHLRRDKSAWGNPVGHKLKLKKKDRHERNMHSASQGKKRIKLRKNNKKQSLRILKKSNRRG